MTQRRRQASYAVLWAGAALLAGALGSAGLVAAHTGASGVVKERMDQMKDAGDATKALADMMRGKSAYDAAAVRRLADRIAGHGGDALTENFPEGSLDPPTEARPEIWENWSRFEDLAHRMEAYARALAKAADNPRAGDQAGSGMMGQGGGMMGQGGGMMGQGGGMMGGDAGPPPERLAKAPPEAAFRRLTQTCSACHKSFRVDK